MANSREGEFVSYGYLGSIKTKPGRRDDVIAILLRGVDGLRAAGCTLYLVAAATSDPDAIWVTEAWLSKQHHDESLQSPDAKASIAEAMPMLTGEFTSEEVAVIGGLGLS